MSSTDIDAIGKTIRLLRTQKKLRLQDVAESTGLSISYLSQIERGKVSPSLSTMKKVADALDVRPGQLMEDPVPIANGEARRVIRSFERRTLVLSEGRMQIDILCSSRGRSLVMVKMTAEPWTESGDALRQEGERCGIVLRGCMELWIGDECYVLNRGDSVYVDHMVEHRWLVRGDDHLEMIWAITPPNY